jgi:hypothetical protein
MIKTLQNQLFAAFFLSTWMTNSEGYGMTGANDVPTNLLIIVLYDVRHLTL